MQINLRVEVLIGKGQDAAAWTGGSSFYHNGLTFYQEKWFLKIGPFWYRYDEWKQDTKWTQISGIQEDHNWLPKDWKEGINKLELLVKTGQTVEQIVEELMGSVAEVV